jgi:hypothetical protein
MRLHLACAADGTPRAATLTGADRPEREVALPLLARCLRGAETIVCDKGYAGREFAEAVAALDGTIQRPKRRDEPGQGPHLAPIRQRIESVFFTCKDLLNLERHGARTLPNLAIRVSRGINRLAGAQHLFLDSSLPSYPREAAALLSRRSARDFLQHVDASERRA